MAQASHTNWSAHFGTFDLDLRSGELRKHGLKIRLPNQSFQVLARLLERPGEIVSREELRQTLWTDDTFVDFEVGLSSAVKKLRDALGDSADNARFIETLPRRGYRFIAPVNRTLDAPSIVIPGALESPKPEVAADQVSTASVAESLATRQPLSLRVAAILLALFTGLSIVSYPAVRHRIAADAKPMSIRSIAVLPLANLTGDPGQEYFVDGMTDDLITELAQVSDARVISRTSAMRYKEVRKAAPQIGQELNVDAIVEGTVARSGSRVRINAQLIDAKNDRHIWAGHYERDANDIVALQADLARAIAEAIAAKVTPGREMPRKASTPVSEDAYALLLKGVMRAGGGGYEGFQEAISYAERAVAKQPDFSRAYSLMALWNVQFSFAGPLSPLEFMPKADAAARRALELDETNSIAHAALGLVLYRFRWDWEGAEQQFRRALQINPSYAEGHRMFGVFLSAAGRTSEGMTEAQEARNIDPLSDNALFNLAVAHRDAGQSEQAISEFRTLLNKRPDLARAHAELGEAYLIHGDLNESLKELRNSIALSDRNPHTLAYLGYADAVIGKTTEAQNILRELDGLSHQRFVSPFDMAGIQAGLGQTDAAFALLEKACEVHDPLLSRLLVDERTKALRSDDRFQVLKRRVGMLR